MVAMAALASSLYVYMLYSIIITNYTMVTHYYVRLNTKDLLFVFSREPYKRIKPYNCILVKRR